MAVSDRFFDTNVLLHLLSEETGKADRAETVAGQGGVISVQVLNEFTSVARRKRLLDWAEITEMVDVFRASFDIVPLTIEKRWSWIFDQFGGGLRWIRFQFMPPVSLPPALFHRPRSGSIRRGSSAGVRCCSN